MFQFPAYIFFSEFSCENVFEFGDLRFKGRMHLAWAYRSLPRPSSQSKPSYPSNSLKDQTILFLIFINGKLSCLSYLLHWILRPNLKNPIKSSYLWSSLPDKQSLIARPISGFLRHPRRDFLVRLWTSRKWIWKFRKNGPAVSRTRGSSVQVRCFTTRLQALFIGQSKWFLILSKYL